MKKKRINVIRKWFFRIFTAMILIQILMAIWKWISEYLYV